jgi:diguanylate cyclase (GGDEF)-like protein
MVGFSRSRRFPNGCEGEEASIQLEKRTAHKLMRIANHVSIILFVAIAGAIGLALSVGMLLSGLEQAADASGRTAEQQRTTEMLVGYGQELVDAVDALNTEDSERSLAIVGNATQRCLVHLLELRHAPVLIEMGPLEEAVFSAEQMIQHIQQAEKRRSAGVLVPEDIAALKQTAQLCMLRIDQLHSEAAAAAVEQTSVLTGRRRMIMLIISVVCVIYLAVIERVRQWTTRRLVRPVQELADVAIKAMEGEEVLPQLEQSGPAELKTLAHMLGTFVDTLKGKVRQRTAELERQKANLEREVASRRQAEDQLRHAAFHDELTGLCNRDLLLDRLDRCIERARLHSDYKFAVLFLDVDRFKEVNDSLGHFVGDQLLVEIAKRLQDRLRASDTLSHVDSNTIARIGGDEFVVLLDGIRDRSDASHVAERLQGAVSDPFQVHGHEVFTTASIGIAFNETDCETGDRLLRDADTAMYYAKAAGKARHEVFNKAMHAEALARLQLGNDLRRAIENNELEVMYHPIVSLRTAQLSGFEALLRWVHPDRGPVPPIEFITRAEETGVIVQLGQWVLEQACAQLRAWREQLDIDPAFSMSVNVSKRQVASPGLVEEVQRILNSQGLDGRHLKLEITESVIMANPDSIAEVLHELKQLGVQVHMDDFGTGYSSLSYLHRFPFDVLKIDRAFMNTIRAKKDYAGVIHTVVSLAHNLDMEVTVEGVESQDQLAQLLALDCDYAQGFFFSQPMNAAAAGRLLTSQPHWVKKSSARRLGFRRSLQWKRIRPVAKHLWALTG